MSDKSDKQSFTVAGYSFRWDAACPHVRIVSPFSAAGIEVIQGGENKLIARAVEADCVLFQREFPPFRQSYDGALKIARNFGKPIIYETDDFLIGLPPEHPGARHYRGLRTDFLRGLLDADCVIATTESLAKELRPFNSNVVIIPNYLDDSIWEMKEPTQSKDDEPLVLGFMGTQSHMPDLLMIESVLLTILNQYPDKVQVKLWGVEPPPRLAVHRNARHYADCPDNYKEFAAYFAKQKMDVAIAPLRDTDFNRCKSNIKFLEYGTLGVPGVYSRVTPYESIVDDGVNGYLVSTADQWYKAIVSLLEDRVKREEMGRQAQKTVKRSWLVSENSHAIRSTFLNQVFPLAQQASKDWRNPKHIASARFVAEQVQSWYKELDSEIKAVDASRSWRFVQRLHGVRRKIVSRGEIITRSLTLRKKEDN